MLACSCLGSRRSCSTFHGATVPCCCADELTEHYATKADLHQLEATLVRWMVGSILGAVSLAAVITFSLGRLI